MRHGGLRTTHTTASSSHVLSTWLVTVWRFCCNSCDMRKYLFMGTWKIKKICVNIFVADMATEKAIVSGRRVTVVIWTTFMVLLLFVFLQPNFCSMSVEVTFGFSFFTLFSAATFPQCNCHFLIVANVGGAFWPILWHMMWHIILSWSAWKWRLCW